MQKLDRDRLIPMIPPRLIYQQQGLPVNYREADDARISCIKAFKDRLGDVVICWIEDAAFIERLATETGKRVIPLMSMETLPCVDETRPSSADIWQYVKMEDPRHYVPTQRYQRYIDYLERNINEFPGIILGNATLELCANYDSGRDRMDYGSVIADIQARFPVLCKKAIFGPIDSMIERDAWSLAKSTLDTGQRESSAKARLLEMNAPIIIFTGFVYLYPSFGRLRAHGYQPRSCGEYSFLLQGRGPFPHAYLKPYFEGLKVYSGVGFYHGAARHNLRRLVDLGMTGGVFFVPQMLDNLGRQQMEMYLTDVY